MSINIYSNTTIPYILMTERVTCDEACCQPSACPKFYRDRMLWPTFRKSQFLVEEKFQILTFLQLLFFIWIHIKSFVYNFPFIVQSFELNSEILNHLKKHTKIIINHPLIQPCSFDYKEIIFTHLDFDKKNSKKKHTLKLLVWNRSCLILM